MTAEPSKTFAEIEAEDAGFARTLQAARERAKAARIERATTPAKPTDIEVTARLAAILERAERAGAR
jgi:hypothetical protein